MFISAIECPPSRWPLKIARLLRSPKKHLSVVHNMLMIGPPGAGKTLLARAMPGILRLVRTIAVLVGEEEIAPTHLAEALQYRPKLQMV